MRRCAVQARKRAVKTAAVIGQTKVGQACAGPAGLASTIICTAFSYFVECYKAKSTIGLGQP